MGQGVASFCVLSQAGPRVTVDRARSRKAGAQEGAMQGRTCDESSQQMQIKENLITAH